MSARNLALGPDLKLPLDFATAGVAVLGMRGSGKSNTEARFAELLYEAEIPFAVVDPKGDWHGIRSSADGKKPGLSVPVFGGLHGDFPLEASAGAQIATLLVEQNISAIIDVSRLSKTGELPRFLTAFFDTLMDLHQREPHVRTIILDEAHRLIPQEVRAELARLKEAAAAILLEGRSWGLGCWAASQRPARINKDVLEEVGWLIIHAIGAGATNDERAIGHWVKHYELGDEILASLRTLRPGEAWVLGPLAGVLKRVQIDRRQTFDSGGTPKVGAVLRKPTRLADIDSAAITAALEESIERAKADDPAHLRREIRRLEAELKTLAEQPVEIPEPEVVEIPVLSDAALEALAVVMDPARELLLQMGAILGAVEVQAPAKIARSAPAPAPAPAARPTPTPRAPTPPPEGGQPITGGALRMLQALAQFPGGLTPGILATRAKMKRSGGSWGTYLSRLRTAGLVVNEGDVLRATQAGLDFVGGGQPALTGEALIDDWRVRLGTEKNGRRRMFEVLLAAYPEAVTADELSARAEVDRNGGSWGTYLSMLRTNGLLQDVAGGFVAAEALYL